MVDVKHWDLFPTKIFESKFVAKDEITNYIKTNQMRNDAPYFARQSVDNNLQKTDAFKPFVKKIYKVTEEMCKIYEYEYRKIEITSMWINISEPSQAHPPHTHSNNIFSGVWYPCDNTDTSNIQFFDPRPQAGLLLPKRKTMDTNNSSIIWFPANKDSMFMFPSWLMHWVPPTSNRRISISFNVILRGEYGEENTLQNANI
jgi:uncharacterized protein (TIGR02466 family)